MLFLGKKWVLFCWNLIKSVDCSKLNPDFILLQSSKILTLQQIKTILLLWQH